MRKWFKYLLEQKKLKGKVFKGKSSTPEEHAKDMGGFHSDASYKNKQDFFENWYLNDQIRLKIYNRFIQDHLDKKAKILSLASGRCAGELYLQEEGYDVTCSDLRELNMHRETRQLFPSFSFFPLDILKPSCSQEKYDAITALSLLYLFDDHELKLFFENASSFLNVGSHLILDPGGAADNWITLFMDEVFLKYETYLMRILWLVLKNKPHALIVKHHGFRRSDQEIVATAKEAGFELVATEHGDFLTEFERSRIFGYLLRKSNLAKKIISILGRKMPYVRLFIFRLVA